MIKTHSKCNVAHEPTIRQVLILVVILGLLLPFAGVFPAGAVVTDPEGFTWMEDGEAGDLPDTANVVTGGGDLEYILGTLDAYLPPAEDPEADMYRIYIYDPENFYATTFTGFTGPEAVDPQLFLFEACGFDGYGVVANDDLAIFEGQAKIPCSVPLTSPGYYYLAISGWDLDPRNIGGRIFPNPYLSKTECYGPTGPGGGLPITGWISGYWDPEIIAAGDYKITLRGASAEPPHVHITDDVIDDMIVGDPIAPGYESTNLACADEYNIVRADMDEDGTDDTMVVFRTLTGEAYLMSESPGPGKWYFFSFIENHCGGGEADRGRLKIHFVDILAPGFVEENENTWTYKRIPSLSIEASHDWCTNGSSNPYQKVQAYRDLNQTNPICGTNIPAGGSWMQYDFSDATGIMELYVSSDYCENTLNDLILRTDEEMEDCNGNGIPDEYDIASDTSNDCNGNGIPDECDLETGLRPGSAALYRIDQNDGATVLDYSGNVNNGTNSHVNYSRDTPFPVPGNFSLQFDAKADAITIPAGPSTNLHSYSALTLEAFVKPTDTIAIHYILWAHDDRFYLRLVDNQLWFGLIGSSGSTSTSEPFTATGVWTHVAGTWDGTTARLYINGEEVDSKPASLGTITVQADNIILIGNDETATCCPQIRDFRGLIDQVRIVKRALAPEEVLFDATHSLMPGSSNDWNGNGIPDECEYNGDFDQDGDVDGSDLAVFAVGGTTITLEELATDFGRTNCPVYE